MGARTEATLAPHAATAARRQPLDDVRRQREEDLLHVCVCARRRLEELYVVLARKLLALLLELKPHMDRQNDWRKGYNEMGALTVWAAMQRAPTTSGSLATRANASETT